MIGAVRGMGETLFLEMFLRQQFTIYFHSCLKGSSIVLEYMYVNKEENLNAPL